MTGQKDLSWMIGEMSGVPGVRHVVVLSADGLLITCSPNTGRDDAERLAAFCASLHSIASSVAKAHGEHQDGRAPFVRQQMVEFQGGFLFVQLAGDNSRLAVVTEPRIDPARVGQEMALQVRRIREGLSVAARGTAPE
ncbi:roadblock/LC7 domain-containing protein [Actinocorallia libanotica]|uniref:Roadblock/LC7 domain-containing protein n=1 Tax=Actinocorallia libanotica TaxID=46162 RepID=A0ABN1REV9_9ACTN